MGRIEFALRSLFILVVMLAVTALALYCSGPVDSARGELDKLVFLPLVMGVVCDCSGNIYNCADFPTQPHAQVCFDYCIAQGFGDVHYLDADDDGIACENLPAPTPTAAEPPPTYTPAAP